MTNLTYSVSKARLLEHVSVILHDMQPIHSDLERLVTRLNALHEELGERVLVEASANHTQTLSDIIQMVKQMSRKHDSDVSKVSHFSAALYSMSNQAQAIPFFGYPKDLVSFAENLKKDFKELEKDVQEDLDLIISRIGLALDSYHRSETGRPRLSAFQIKTNNLMNLVDDFQERTDSYWQLHDVKTLIELTEENNVTVSSEVIDTVSTWTNACPLFMFDAELRELNEKCTELESELQN